MAAVRADMVMSMSRRSDDDAELFEHYVHRGATAWNVSLEAAWLDYELRAWFAPRLLARRPAAVANVGIGVGLWDDWLGHLLERSITSIDRDADICRVFAVRQRRERHPHAARVVCGDAATVLGRDRYDAITIVGSTLAESADRQRLLDAADRALRSGGRVLVADVGEGTPPAGDEVRRLGTLWITFAERPRARQLDVVD